jgi:hypothetical protein
VGMVICYDQKVSNKRFVVNEKCETMIFMMMMLASMGPLINMRGVQDSWKQGEYRILQIIFFFLWIFSRDEEPVSLV